METQRVQAFLQQYIGLCQQYNLMIDCFAQAEMPIISPCYKDRLIKIGDAIINQVHTENNRMAEEAKMAEATTPAEGEVKN